MSQSTAARVLPRPNPRPVGRTATPVRLRVVAPRAGRSRAGLAVLCVSMLITGLLALLLLNISLSNGAYQLTNLQKLQLQSSEQQQALAEQVDQLSAPQALAQRAAKLGMVPAPNTVFVRLPDGTVVGQAATAKAPPAPQRTGIQDGAASSARIAAAGAAAPATTAKTTTRARTPVKAPAKVSAATTKPATTPATKTPATTQR